METDGKERLRLSRALNWHVEALESLEQKHVKLQNERDALLNEVTKASPEKLSPGGNHLMKENISHLKRR